jgi:magnesium transporter
MNSKLQDYIQGSKFIQARDELIQMNPVDIAQLLETLETEKMIVTFRLLPKELAADVFSYMSNKYQEHIIEGATDSEMKSILNELFFDDTIDLLEEMPSNVVKKILKNTSSEKRTLINQFLDYPQDSAGSIMTIEYIALKKEMSVESALTYIKKNGVDKETIHTCYVTDKNRKLEGLITLRKLILSDSNISVGDLMQQNIRFIHTHDDQENIAGLFKKYDFLSMPVVDNENRLVGIITIDDIVDIIDQENTEDFQKMAAMQPSDGEYLDTNILSLAKHRILWLLVLMISATFTGNIIRQFEDILQTVVVLTAFIPMLMDTGGNAGSQSATLVIRGLALDEIQLKDILKVLWKELRVSFVVGIALAGINFIRIYYFEKTDFMITLVVCLSLFMTIILAKIVGGVLPIFAKKLNLDPAIMASPLITTIVDAFALMAYFSLASALIGL